ncbi:arabinose transporter permease [Pseudomonas coronafaciens pv. porri]|uniref:Arabinose transporter permease n=1 Tax=Pseudomonas coronafaciens pv. porri TaxID=83964 RepID=A0ABR5JK37_9PSED|nr:MFS transporter [Pseudomonas coronafaciens]KOP54348.1 arabinose transporter permease [Pseudomonas coronafaciens pv. porri]KOP54702.1 arabinose transporter permease [Pseudomonas coronafaciens pv. porri]KPY27964.1 proteinral substrate transporter:Major facilitator superfamily [Pseudomonas coronafaciens pv. porri]RMU87046.1 proteinral substrate transporter:Major facilitator superfamily [Pseudomonas coronafaciens pv. porri]RMV99298.1 proteinral substrate transporter:Major facilitator superfamil
MPLSLLILALSAFAIGTTEFVIMGLLPDVAADLGVSIPGAGWLVTGYALGVAVGAPFMAMATAKLPRKAALVTLMGIFIIGNLLCALASDYNVLMFARVVTALCHGAFFGIGSVVAAGLVPANRRASAVALMFTGLTLANVLGVPLGTALGQYAGWRSTFWAVTVIGIIALIGLIRFLPTNRNEEKLDMRAELGALRGAGIWLSLTMTALFSASMFTLFTYIAPLLGEVTGVSPNGVTWTLLLIGLGLTAGNVIGGKMADRRLSSTLIGVFASMAVISTALSWTSIALIPTEITLFLWAVAAFAAVPALQINVVTFGKAVPNLVSTLNIGAFNVGNALGAWVGGSVIAHGLGLTSVPLAAAVLAVLALLITLITFRQTGNPDLAHATH